MNATMAVIEALEKNRRAVFPYQLKTMMAEQGVPNFTPTLRLALAAAMTQGPCGANALRLRMGEFGYVVKGHFGAPITRGGFNARLRKRCYKREIAALLVGRRNVYVGGWHLRDVSEQFELHNDTDRKVAADWLDDNGGDPAVSDLLRKAKKICFGW